MHSINFKGETHETSGNTTRNPDPLDVSETCMAFHSVILSAIKVFEQRRSNYSIRFVDTKTTLRGRCQAQDHFQPSYFNDVW